jgi:hypothetical protein
MQIDERAVDSVAKEKSYPHVKIKRVIHTIHAVIDIAAGRAKYLDVLVVMSATMIPARYALRYQARS